MKLIQIDEKEIKGISIRTKNFDEMNPKTSKLGGLWQQFYKEMAPNLTNDATVFGVYYDYESDVSGEFSVLAGTDGIKEPSTSSMEKVSILRGNYLLFEAKGDMPQVVVDVWSEIWTYFSSDEAEYQRTYTTDFERYKGQNEIEIYIAVKELGDRP